MEIPKYSSGMADGDQLYKLNANFNSVTGEMILLD
jgi:hypothetical protein